MNVRKHDSTSVSTCNSSLSKIEHKLEFAESLLQGVAEATRILLTVVEYKRSINSSLAVLGHATQVDRVYIFQYHLHPSTQHPVISQRYEWVKDGISPEIDNLELQNFPFQDILPRWYHQLSRGKSIAGLVNTFPESEQVVLNPQNILSIVVVPILIEKQFWGFIGFDDCSFGHAWSSSEVAVLRAVANSFGGAIARSQAQEKLQKANDTLILLAADLIRAKEQANHASHVKGLFLARMSHELRTPLNGILGYSQIIQRRTQNDTETLKGVQVINQCAAHLLDLINDVLDFSKLEEEQLTIAPEPINLRLLFDEILRVCIVQAQSKKIEIQHTVSAEVPYAVMLDAKRLRQVLMNLLSNSIKFTDAGQVTLSVKQEKRYVRSTIEDSEPIQVAKIKFEVSDTGVGISPEDTNRIFEAFEQCGELSQQVDGTGLGLNISQRIISAMGGAITVQSSLGVGSCFSFSLDLPILETQPSQEDPMKSDDVELHHSRGCLGLQSETTSRHFSHIEIPEKGILEYCWKLVQSGRLPRLKVYATMKAQEMPEAAPFLKKISALASNFKIEELESLLRRNL